MKKLAIWLVSFTIAQIVSTTHADENLYEECAVCHGENAEGVDAVSAPQLAGQNPTYLIEQLVNYRSGARGIVRGDVSGQLMANSARSLGDAQINLLANYLSQLTPTPMPVPSGGGDKDRGKTLYEENCLACHGHNAEGIDALASPNLLILSAKYIKSQLSAYEEGWRGHSDYGTTRSKSMRTMVVHLNDEEDIQNLIAFLHR